MNKRVEICCNVDDFCRVCIPELEKQLIADGSQKRRRTFRMLKNEIMTIIIAFHEVNTEQLTDISASI